MHLLQFINTSKSYPNGQRGVIGVNLKLQAGELAFLTGHSGAGKSTLLKLIPRLLTPTGGQILLKGKNVHRLAPRHIPALRRSIGMIFQDSMLLPKRTVFENVALPLHFGNFTANEKAKRVRAALDKVGLLSKEKCFPLELSSGEQQRVNIARAVVNRPILLLADEPTGNLDPQLSMEIMQLFEEFHRIGVGVLVASHDLTLIARMNHRIITLKSGQVIHTGAKAYEDHYV